MTAYLPSRNCFMKNETCEKNMRKASVSAAHRDTISTHTEALRTIILKYMELKEALQLAIIAESKCCKETKYTGAV